MNLTKIDISKAYALAAVLALVFMPAAPCSVAAQTSGARPISFRQLPPGDAIVVRYLSSGCFHRVAYQFEFRHDSNYTVDVSPINARADDAQASDEASSQCTLALSDADITGLERLLTFYRTVEDPTCTTVDRIECRQVSGSAVKSVERFIDGTCESNGLADVVTFMSLAARCRREGN
ncbi:MAG TPA: hypothetical protein VHI13_17450 [Candidatus Kapabacteria bacterium]|nr:hypothetical protein [Candidatus Kapabacteria bacterium]